LSALEVRTRVEAALLAAGVPLGTYTLPGGQPTPAISVGDPPQGTTATGLEVLISRNPQQRAPDAFQFVGYIEAYPIRLVNRDHVDLEAATNAIAQEFWPFDEDPVLLPESPQTYEQVTFSVTL